MINLTNLQLYQDARTDMLAQTEAYRIESNKNFTKSMQYTHRSNRIDVEIQNLTQQLSNIKIQLSNVNGQLKTIDEQCCQGAHMKNVIKKQNSGDPWDKLSDKINEYRKAKKQLIDRQAILQYQIEASSAQKSEYQQTAQNYLDTAHMLNHEANVYQKRCQIAQKLYDNEGEKLFGL